MLGAADQHPATGVHGFGDGQRAQVHSAANGADSSNRQEGGRAPLRLVQSSRETLSNTQDSARYYNSRNLTSIGTFSATTSVVAPLHQPRRNVTNNGCTLRLGALLDAMSYNSSTCHRLYSMSHFYRQAGRAQNYGSSGSQTLFV